MVKPTSTSSVDDARYQDALATIEHSINKIERCGSEEKKRLRDDLAALRAMETKLNHGRVEVIIFGEISTGKSALINALVGRQVSEVNVRGGWTKEVWNVHWNMEGYHINGLNESELVLVDTPGLNEVGGDDRAKLSHEIAQRADLVLFLTDSDLNETEFSAVVSLAAASKPIIMVLNKIDLYSRAERGQLVDVLQERLENIVTPDNFVLTAADPREQEFIIESADGSSRTEWRKPPPDVEQLKERILEILERDGLALLALNGAMYAADKTDRIAKLRIEFRERQANQTIWSFAGFKALVVAANPIAIADVLGGTAVDASMIVTLAHIYGLEMSWANARRLIASIGFSAGWVVLAEWATHLVAGTFKTLTLGFGTVLTMVPQGAAAGFGSYIVGQAAKYYFEHGASWGHEAPKTVVRRILAETDKDSVLQHLKDEITKKISRNVHS